MRTCIITIANSCSCSRSTCTHYSYYMFPFFKNITYSIIIHLFFKAPEKNPENIKIQGPLPHQLDISWEVRDKAHWSVRLHSANYYSMEAGFWSHQYFHSCCSRCCLWSIMAQALSTRWATGSWAWKMSGRSIWSKGTPLSWGTRPPLSPSRSKFRAGTATAGDRILKSLPVTLERTVSYRLNTCSTACVHVVNTLSTRVYLLQLCCFIKTPQAVLAHGTVVSLVTYCVIVSYCLQPSFGTVCGRMCQVKLFPFSPLLLVVF